MPLETTISTLRHGSTQFNAEKRYAGTIDIPLSEAGVRDVSEASTKISLSVFDVVVTSEQRRAIQTAEILVDGKMKIVRSPLCNERRFGVMEGLTWDDIQHLQPPVLMIAVGNELHTVNPTGGEPFEDVWERARKFRRFLLSNHGGRRILVVSHGVFLQMFHGVLRGLNCIESLARYPGNLELARFRLAGTRLMEEEVIRLSDAVSVKW